MNHEFEQWYMARALELAERGRGHVEPNPMVGCVLVQNGAIIAEGWHEQFGGPHAEVNALRAAGLRAQGSTLFVTLEPCCHHGKTPPCTQAIIAAGVQRVVCALADPFAQVNEQGIGELRRAGITVDVGVLADEARRMNAPYLKRLATGKPWVIAKWAMTLDGKIATAAGDSRWISGEAARQKVHTERGRMDAILVGRRTAELDDPLLTARPSGPRVATRVVLDRQVRLPLTSRLVQTARETPVLIAAQPNAPQERLELLRGAGCDVWLGAEETSSGTVDALLLELGKRGMTNLLVEGGSEVLGAFFDGEAIDEYHIWLATKLIGGAAAPAPIGGAGLAAMHEARRLHRVEHQLVGDDLYIHGFARP